jgi:hypothetical protein
MPPLNAPEGYEALYFYDDYSKCYVPSVRSAGATWWTTCLITVPTHLTPEETVRRAQHSVDHFFSTYVVPGHVEV